MSIHNKNTRTNLTMFGIFVSIVVVLISSSIAFAMKTSADNARQDAVIDSNSRSLDRIEQKLDLIVERLYTHEKE